MNGKLLWKRNSSSTSVNQLPVWTYLCLQLDMECNEKTAKFFLGEKLNEEIELGVSKLPPDIQVVVIATGPLRVYKSHKNERKGQRITKLIEWIELSKQDNEQYEQLIEIEKKMPLKLKSINQIFEKAVFRVSNKYSNSENSRRFGFIAEEDEILNNIPIPGKNFRAITYDEKEGIIRFGQHEVFRWIPTKDGLMIIFEVDLHEDIACNTIRIFCEFEECPIIFVNVPKRLKLYFAFDSQPDTNFNHQIFKLPKPTKPKDGDYERVIDYNMDLSVLNLEQKKKEKFMTRNPESFKSAIVDDQIPINFEELLNQMNLQENQTGIITAEEKQTQFQQALQIKNPLKILEKGIFRINNYFINTQNSRRFGMIADGAEVFNNIPISNKDFRAITYDEKEGIFRLGWLEVFKWNYAPKDSQQPMITFEIDLREEIEHNTARLFIGSEESPIIFMDVPKKLNIYVQYMQMKMIE
ncbi:MAG: hypothetical protein EZS28_026526 [Streblomastix strix]|uniref:Uncharacterized protein n=1 Tax=Streblomastix strix TaxID=222440 RepID=A0A5J4V5T2_9EUKA|nr:MAG: hypothetical protein EZS28_026526 [Streblomastix strix]